MRDNLSVSGLDTLHPFTAEILVIPLHRVFYPDHPRGPVIPPLALVFQPTPPAGVIMTRLRRMIVCSFARG